MALQLNNIDINRIEVFENKKKDPSQLSQTFRIKYRNDNNQLIPFYIQTPKMYVPFGISSNEKYRKTENDRVKWNLLLSFKDEDTNTKINQFRTIWKNIEDQVLKIFMEKFSDFMELPDADPAVKFAVLKSQLYSSIKKTKQKEGHPTYADNFSCLIPWDAENNCPQKDVGFYDKHQNIREYTDVVPRSNVITIIHLNGISLVSGRLSFSVKLNQLQFFPPEVTSNTLKGFQIQVDEESELEDNEDGSSVEINMGESDEEESEEKQQVEQDELEHVESE